ncbi:uncharacterized protein LAESUDRAFT_710255 [Laetiporus sulphureus 93-53]|uniref:F-box domain-containing protein n=1 Tax=Laetiporus sulphureus 93-53 TaxID=1314785 RepID=A0A165IKM2_9APHY|nr:uncharacterized protein LAESUDRAFT_710255 [Laetiporus sulphureus 93-53]KZT13210.1 hypothetical protein LAESUDRAFT_710255 [Laetiporus sulphureus 93-53]
MCIFARKKKSAMHRTVPAVETEICATSTRIDRPSALVGPYGGPVLVPVTTDSSTPDGVDLSSASVGTDRGPAVAPVTVVSSAVASMDRLPANAGIGASPSQMEPNATSTRINLLSAMVDPNEGPVLVPITTDLSTSQGVDLLSVPVGTDTGPDVAPVTVMSSAVAGMDRLPANAGIDPSPSGTEPGAASTRIDIPSALDDPNGGPALVPVTTDLSTSHGMDLSPAPVGADIGPAVAPITMISSVVAGMDRLPANAGAGLVPFPPNEGSPSEASVLDMGLQAAMDHEGHFTAMVDEGQLASMVNEEDPAAMIDEGYLATTVNEEHLAAMIDQVHLTTMADEGHLAATANEGHLSSTGHIASLSMDSSSASECISTPVDIGSPPPPASKRSLIKAPAFDLGFTASAVHKGLQPAIASNASLPASSSIGHLFTPVFSERSITATAGELPAAVNQTFLPGPVTIGPLPAPAWTAPYLAPELVHKIMKNLTWSEPQALVNCALACKAWHKLSKKHLPEMLELNSYVKFHELAQIIISSGRIKGPSPIKYLDLVEDIIPHLFKAVTEIELHFPFYKSLDKMQTFLGAFPKLVNLKLGMIRYRPKDDQSSALSVTPDFIPVEPQLQLQKLVLENEPGSLNTNAAFVNWLVRALAPHAFKELQVKMMQALFRPVKMDHMNKILKILGGAIQTFKLEVQSGFLADQQIALAYCISLISLTLRTWDNHPLDTLWNNVANTLSQIASTQLQMLNMGFKSDIKDSTMLENFLENLDKHNANLINGVIKHEKFLELKTVSIDFKLPYIDDKEMKENIQDKVKVHIQSMFAAWDVRGIVNVSVNRV